MRLPRLVTLRNEEYNKFKNYYELTLGYRKILLIFLSRLIQASLRSQRPLQSPFQLCRCNIKYFII